MKRGVDISDKDWNTKIEDRADLAKLRMERADNINGFTTLEGIAKA